MTTMHVLDQVYAAGPTRAVCGPDRQRLPGDDTGRRRRRLPASQSASPCTTAATFSPNRWTPSSPRRTRTSTSSSRTTPRQTTRRRSAARYAARDPRIRYFRSDVNRGASWNYRTVIERSSAPYFKWATHDDLIAPTYMERCMDVFAEAPTTVALVYGKTKIIDDKSDFVRTHDENLDIRDPRPHRAAQDRGPQHRDGERRLRADAPLGARSDTLPRRVSGRGLRLHGRARDRGRILGDRRVPVLPARARGNVAEGQPLCRRGSRVVRSRLRDEGAVEGIRDDLRRALPLDPPCPRRARRAAECYATYVPTALRRYRKRMRPEITAAISYSVSRRLPRRRTRLRTAPSGSRAAGRDESRSVSKVGTSPFVRTILDCSARSRAGHDATTKEAG